MIPRYYLHTWEKEATSVWTIPFAKSLIGYKLKFYYTHYIMMILDMKAFERIVKLLSFNMIMILVLY